MKGDNCKTELLVTKCACTVKYPFALRRRSSFQTPATCQTTDRLLYCDKFSEEEWQEGVVLRYRYKSEGRRVVLILQDINLRPVNGYKFGDINLRAEEWLRFNLV